MSEQGRTALVLPVPAADALLAAVAAKHPEAVRPGIPAHISVLYPFLDAALVTAECLAWLAAFAAERQPSTIDFTAVDRQPGFVYLSSTRLAPLNAAVRTRWPQIVPYGGRFGTAPPAHLTVAMDFAVEKTEQVAELVTEFLPLTAIIDEIWLLTFESSWQRTGRFRFGIGCR